MEPAIERERGSLSRSRAYLVRSIPYHSNRPFCLCTRSMGSATTAAWLSLVALWLCINHRRFSPLPPFRLRGWKIFYRNRPSTDFSKFLACMALGQAVLMIFVWACPQLRSHSWQGFAVADCVQYIVNRLWPRKKISNPTCALAHQLCVSSLLAPSPVGSSTG